jgi:hypothetical protein
LALVSTNGDIVAVCRTNFGAHAGSNDLTVSNSLSIACPIACAVDAAVGDTHACAVRVSHCFTDTFADFFTDACTKLCADGKSYAYAHCSADAGAYSHAHVDAQP